MLKLLTGFDIKWQFSLLLLIKGYTCFRRISGMECSTGRNVRLGESKWNQERNGDSR